MLIKEILPGFVKRNLKKLFFGAENFRIQFSQCGEDLILRSVLLSIGKVDKGLYIDVGSFHPTIGSNTYLLYRKGWNGINIDPRPGSKKLFDSMRPDDINLEFGIGKSAGTMKYYFISDTSPMNSFSKKTLEDNGVFDKVTKVIDCEILTLKDIIDNYVPKSESIDFLNIDVEGLEPEVLATLDWNNKRPIVIAIELNMITSLDDVLLSDTNLLLRDCNYVAVAKNFITKSVSTVFYVDKKYL